MDRTLIAGFILGVALGGVALARAMQVLAG